MRTITKITTQKRSSKRLNVYLNDEYGFSVGEDIYVKYHLHKGQQLSKEKIATIIEADDLQRAYLLAIHFLSYRMRSTAEVRTYLQKKELDEQTIATIIDRLLSEKLLNDSEFAIVFVRDRMNRSTKGPILIKKELAEKGISHQHFDGAFLQYDDDLQVMNALKWAEKEINKQRKYSFTKLKGQLQTKLRQRGFSTDIIQQVIEQLDFEKDAEQEKYLLKVQGEKLYTKYKRKYTGIELRLKLQQALFRRGFTSEDIQKYIDSLEII